MAILTQRNAMIVFALQVAWGSMLASGSLPHHQWVDATTALMNATTAALAFLGFTRTPAGNRLSPETIIEVDRKAVVARAGDAVLDSAAKKIVEDSKL